MEKLAEEYDGKLLVYKINVDQEKELSQAFNIRSIPAVMFIPVAESSSTRGASATSVQPMMQVGAMPEEGYRKVIEEQLLK
jgi:thioredoxin-like negative regulator of GroEL